MPRIMIDVSTEWLARYNEVMPSAINALEGFEAQIRSAIIDGKTDPDDLLEQLYGQIKDLRRSLEATRPMF